MVNKYNPDWLKANNLKDGWDIENIEALKRSIERCGSDGIGTYIEINNTLYLESILPELVKYKFTITPKPHTDHAELQIFIK